MGLCEPPFWKDQTVLFKHFTLEYNPTCQHFIWNFIARLFLLSLFVGMIASVLGGLSAFVVVVLFGIITTAVIIGTSPYGFHWDEDTPKKRSHRKSHHKKSHHKKRHNRDDDSDSDSDDDEPRRHPPVKDKPYKDLPYIARMAPSGYIAPTKEHFVNGGSSMGSVQPHPPSGMVEVDAFPYSGPALPEYTPPTSRNLFMNVLLDEIKYNTGRPEAAPVVDPAVKQTLDDYFRIQWFSDPTDVFGKNQSQRQFVTQPSTTVPNDQGAFANWLYKIPGKTCKEGGRAACLSGTDGGPVPWLNQAS